MFISFACALLVAISFLLTLLVRRLSLKYQIIDQPNDRSSHIVATPRGGGLAIIISSYLAMALIFNVSLFTHPLLLAFTFATILVSIVGCLDDIYSLSAKTRLLVHALAASWALYWINGFPSINFLSYQISLFYIVGFVLGVIYLIWTLNSFNFMDGIDGIAGIQVVSVCLSVLGIMILSEQTQDVVVSTNEEQVIKLLLLILTASSLGFLLLNFPKAKIFMGDAGSGFLGLGLGLMSLMMAWQNAVWFWCWLVLMGVFIVDSGVTLIRRFLNGESVTQAHRSHAYQHAALRYNSHVIVSITVAIINTLFLAPIAYLIYVQKIPAPLGLLVSYIPLLCIAYYYNAGKSN